jgi:hypothetical protein
MSMIIEPTLLLLLLWLIIGPELMLLLMWLIHWYWYS